MRRFLLYLIILLNIVFSINSIGQTAPSFVRFDLPSFIPVNNNFNASIVFRLSNIEAERVSIKFHKPNSIILNSAHLIINSAAYPIEFSSDKNNPNKILVEFNADEFELIKNKLYQIILECYSSKKNKLIKSSFGLENEIREGIEKKSTPASSESEISETEIYEDQKTAGSSLNFETSSLLSFKISKENKWENIYTEFWLKSINQVNNFLTIEKSNTKDTIISVSKNGLGFASFPISENELVRKDIYLGDNSWNYIGVMLKNKTSGLTIEVYLNEQLAYSTVTEDNFDIQNLQINFNTVDEDASFNIDRLKIWDFKNNISLSQKNKHFLTYEADSSKLIYQSNFDNVGEFSSDYKNNELEIIKTNLQYKKSDAPIFSKAPRLTVTIGSSYNSIVWYVQEYSVAKEFKIERAISDGNFEEVYTTLADDDPLKIYFFTDELIKEHEVAYYRVKQINMDNSEVYSAEVKIGNKEIQEFNLSQNYPNPFNPITNIYVEVIIPTEVKVEVYDLVGNTVSELYKGYLAEGIHTFEFDGSELPSGIYFYEVISPKSQIVKKMILAK